jgi:hypothetical protein
MRRFNGAWNRIWASAVGRYFFKMAAFRMKDSVRMYQPSNDATELVLGRAAEDIFEALPEDVRTQVPEVPTLIRRLERDAEVLRHVGHTGEDLTEAVAALENLRLGMLRIQAGSGSVNDLTAHLEHAQEIGDRIDADLLGRDDVERLLG